ncbi:sensor histidine kinase [Kribbella shirazensis]|uniref:histidine kinase n=1 Tax=Kribbella shirazensis TaxID=1105143 RepID=A0A7X5VKA8_9ACTN|nr:histidine kinase [Kribbella shirazensis]NIK62431.1 signal transduction histidine kinase [Kribbella shirazensis]
MERLIRFCRALARHPLALDLALALVILLINLLVPGGRHIGERIELNATVVVLAVVGAVAITFRRRAPITVLVITTGVAAAFVIAEQAKSPIVIYLGVAVFTVVLSKDRLTRCVAVIATALVTLVAEVFFVGGDVLDNLGLVFFVLFSGAIGEAVRNRRAYLRELEERALRAERSRDEEAQRRVIEERLRIAHELHDVIAHHIALMNVQSGVAAHVLRTQPDEAEHALALVRSGGRTVLQELTVLLGVLRRSGSPLPTAPAPSLNELGALIHSFSAAGVEVDWTPPSALGDLPDVIELTAYRIVQESLTNVLKHAPTASARVRITRAPGSLTIAVTDTGPSRLRPNESRPAATPAITHLGAGHGLIGMRERVTAVGGELVTGPEPSGGWAVRAVLPLETGVDVDDPGIAGRRPDADPQRVPGAGELSSRSGGRR